MAKRIQRTKEEAQTFLNRDNISWKSEREQLIALIRQKDLIIQGLEAALSDTEDENKRHRAGSRKLLIWLDCYYETYPDTQEPDDNPELEAKKAILMKKRLRKFYLNRWGFWSLPEPKPSRRK